MDDSNIIVSIFCLVYNHEKYIKKALDSFVNQKTCFKFEVLVHDDASTDRSADIIREYQQKYPDIIKPIFQKENQHSKGVRIIKDYLLPVAKGEFLAWCEGDDYWTDDHKLQTQYDFMRTYPSCCMCCHSVIIKSGERIIGKYPSTDIEAGIYDANKSLDFGYFQTSSFFIKKTSYVEELQYKQNKPEMWGSESVLMYQKLNGDFGYINSDMSVYNYMTEESWTKRQSVSKQRQIDNCLRFMLMLWRFYIDSECKYGYFTKMINVRFNQYLRLCDKSRTIKDEKYKMIFRCLTYKTKLKYYIWLIFPHLWAILVQMTHKKA